MLSPSLEAHGDTRQNRRVSLLRVPVAMPAGRGGCALEGLMRWDDSTEGTRRRASNAWKGGRYEVKYYAVRYGPPAMAVVRDALCFAGRGDF